jgi:hypothetical protein
MLFIFTPEYNFLWLHTTIHFLIRAYAKPGTYLYQTKSAMATGYSISLESAGTGIAG